MELLKEDEHIFVEKGWGFERWWVNEEYCGKTLHFYAGKQLSWHYHLIKKEHFLLMSGKVIVKFSWENDLEAAQEVTLEPGMTFAVPVGLRHRVIAIEESEIMEFSTHHEDSDSIKLIKGD